MPKFTPVFDLFCSVNKRNTGKYSIKTEIQEALPEKVVVILKTNDSLRLVNISKGSINQVFLTST